MISASSSNVNISLTVSISRPICSPVRRDGVPPPENGNHPVILHCIRTVLISSTSIFTYSSFFPFLRPDRKENHNMHIFSHKTEYEYIVLKVASAFLLFCAKAGTFPSETAPAFLYPLSVYLSSSFNTLINAFCGISTFPTWRIRFFPSFCFSRSFFLRLISPP